MRRGNGDRPRRASSRGWKPAVSLQAEREAARHLARALGWPFVDLGEYAISCGILRRVPAELACRLRAVPMVHNARRVVLVVDEPFSAYYLLANRALVGLAGDARVEFALTTRSGLDAGLARRLTLARG